MATKKLTPKKIEKVYALAQKALVPDGFDPTDAKEVRAFRKKQKDWIKDAEKTIANTWRRIDALDKILGIIAPPKEE